MYINISVGRFQMLMVFLILMGNSPILINEENSIGTH